MTPAQKSRIAIKEKKPISIGETKLEMTPDLAEVCGIHAGDGYMRKRGNNYELEISGSFDEKGYYDLHVVPLFERTFGIKLKPQYFKSKGTYGFRTSNKIVCETLHSIGFPFGNKTLTVSVPKLVSESSDLDIIYRFVRGVFDTDGTLSFKKQYGKGYSKIDLKRHAYPRIQLGVCSENLALGVAKILTRASFNLTTHKARAVGNRKEKTILTLRGKPNLESWIKNIGFKNETKLNRFLIWKKYGFNPPSISLAEQKELLNNKRDPDSYYPDGLSLKVKN